MSRVDWSELSDDDVFASLSASPKIAGRWSRQTSGRYVRRDPWGSDVAHVWRVAGGAENWIFFGRMWGDRRAFRPSAAEAIAACDAELRRRGYRLLDGGDEPVPDQLR